MATLFTWLRWLTQWPARRRLRQRALFRYHDGQRVRYGDPAEIWRALLNHPKFSLADTMPAAVTNQEPEVSIALAALREIFLVDGWNEEQKTGLTTWETLDLIRQFQDYMLALKKNTSPWQMPLLHLAFQPSTPSPPSPNTDDQPEPDTRPTSDSSSTPTESAGDGPTNSSEPFQTA